MFIICLAMVISLAWLCSSFTMNIMSNLESIVGMKSIFSSPLVSSHRPNTEFAAANTEQREFSVVVSPALAMEIVCCSIASCMATLSSSLILSNSSIQTTPPSANTIAPPSKAKLLECGSLITEAVSPEADDPFPDV
uniref:Putative conserved secreted protein n=1 Tax=Panstrongylus lignarius TaxID=156445 RepID=A0A224Y107_9HEMI